VVYDGPKDVSVNEVPDAAIEAPTDAVVKTTATNICGSDLHMYEGCTSLEPGKVIAHENLGEVVGVGAGIDGVKVGDRVPTVQHRLRVLQELRTWADLLLSDR
jgi:threonine dehydrogenase-like Zn-dependent dehydrogenase